MADQRHGVVAAPTGGRRCGRRGLHKGWLPIEQGQDALPSGFGGGAEPAEVADALKTFGQNLLEEAAKKRIPLGRFGTMDEFANLAAFLVSDGSGYINGEVVTMDGGEWLQGAGEFTALGRELTEKEWAMMRPKKSAPNA